MRGTTELGHGQGTGTVNRRPLRSLRLRNTRRLRVGLLGVDIPTCTRRKVFIHRLDRYFRRHVSVIFTQGRHVNRSQHGSEHVTHKLHTRNIPQTGIHGAHRNAGATDDGFLNGLVLFTIVSTCLVSLLLPYLNAKASAGRLFYIRHTTNRFGPYRTLTTVPTTSAVSTHNGLQRPYLFARRHACTVRRLIRTLIPRHQTNGAKGRLTLNGRTQRHYSEGLAHLGGLLRHFFIWHNDIFLGTAAHRRFINVRTTLKGALPGLYRRGVTTKVLRVSFISVSRHQSIVTYGRTPRNFNIPLRTIINTRGWGHMIRHTRYTLHLNQGVSVPQYVRRRSINVTVIRCNLQQRGHSTTLTLSHIDIRVQVAVIRTTTLTGTAHIRRRNLNRHNLTNVSVHRSSGSHLLQRNSPLVTDPSRTTANILIPR